MEFFPDKGKIRLRLDPAMPPPQRHERDKFEDEKEQELLPDPVQMHRRLHPPRLREFTKGDDPYNSRRAYEMGLSSGLLAIILRKTRAIIQGAHTQERTEVLVSIDDLWPQEKDLTDEQRLDLHLYENMLDVIQAQHRSVKEKPVAPARPLGEKIVELIDKALNSTRIGPFLFGKITKRASLLEKYLRETLSGRSPYYFVCLVPLTDGQALRISWRCPEEEEKEQEKKKK